MSNPYKGLPPHHFWSQGVAIAPMGGIDPVIQPKFVIAKDELVSTIGSCFAQHISRHLMRNGFSYYVSEQAPQDMAEDLKSKYQYGVFSARYGNVYTVRQAVQLVERALGNFTPIDDVWEHDGGFVDALRPQVQPEPFETIDDVITERAKHLLAVRRIIENSDVLVFTLGLSEAWRSKLDGTVYPTAPGVHGGLLDEDKYEFCNFNITEIIDDLSHFVERVHQSNSRIKILLTVSPVPLIATYERRHVLVSNTVSKSKMRVAADVVANKYSYVDYFPSFEIIAGSALGARYFEDDLRQVNELGVSHVMRVFTSHMLEGSGVDRVDQLMVPLTSDSTATSSGVVCDEEIIEKVIALSNKTTDDDEIESKSKLKNTSYLRRRFRK